MLSGNNWPSVTYSTTSSGSNTIQSVTDAAGKTGTYTYNSVGQLIAVRRPGAATDDVTIAYGGNGVSNISRSGVGYSYSYVDDDPSVPPQDRDRTTSVSGPLSFARTVRSKLSTSLVASDKDALNRTTLYEYDDKGRPPKVTAPEGNYTSYHYDANDNLDLTTLVAKAGSGLASITNSAVFPSTCTNPVTCHSPTSTTDGRGNTTDYTYDATHGGVLSATLPAPTSGADRPQVRYGYATRQAYYKQSSGGSPAAGSAIYLPTTVSTCRTGTSANCLGTAEERLTSVDYGPQTSGTANNLLPVSVTRGSGNASGTGALRATVALTYDMIGNRSSIDGPLPGTADTTVLFYDADRRTTGVIGPDPDGSGSLKYRAQRNTYNDDGQVAVSEAGTATSQSSMASFAALQKVALGYDAYGRRVTASAINPSNGATLMLTQTGYDALGRGECTAVRMNSATYANLPAACSLGTSGSYGQDRITRIGYDAASQATSQTIAYGTTDQAIQATMTYTANGQMATSKDAKNNLTTYAYDGFDRLYRTYFPNPTSPGVSATNDFFESAYDANSNLTSLRLRNYTQYFTFTYDALNRQTARTPSVVAVGAKAAFAYDNLNEITALTDQSGSNYSYSYGYDALGRQTSEAGPLATLSYGYDLAGRRTAIGYGDGFSVSYNRLVTGELTGIYENGGSALTTFSFDDLGRRTVTSRPNGRNSGYGYDAVSRLSTLSTVVSAGTTTATFGYNPAGQIVSRSTDNDIVVSNAAYNVSRSYAANGLNQYTSAGPVGIVHSARGSVARLGADTYTYNGLDELTGRNTTDSYTRDPAGRLVRESGTAVRQYVYDGQNLVLEKDAAGTTLRRYVHGESDDEPLVWYEGSGTGTKRWLAADERGSVTAITDAGGATVAVNQYDEWGIPAPGNVGRFGYTGQVWIDSLKAWNYKARIYHPLIGRFLQPDPIGYAAGLNLYNYVGADPVNGWDPSGMADPHLDIKIIPVNPNENPPDPQDIIVKARIPIANDGPRPVNNAGPVGSPSAGERQGATETQNDIVVTGKRIVRAVQNHPYIATGVALGIGALVCPECDVAEIVVTARRAGFFTRLFQRIFGQACFAAGTLVQTDHGLRPIETIKPGDMVLSRDEQTGRTVYKRVTAVKTPTQDDLYTVELDVPAGQEAAHHAEFQATATHPWRTTDGHWVQTTQLRSGMTLVRADGAPARVEWVRDTKRKAPTYNLTVEGYHTYFVGKDHVWVHNTCPPGLRDATGGELSNAAARDGFDSVEEWKTNGLGLNSRYNIGVGKNGNLYSYPLRGGEVEDLGINIYGPQ